MTSDATDIAAAWLGQFGAALARGDVAGVVSLFGDECFWRDLVAFTWNIKTFEGREQIAAMLAATLPTTAPRGWRIAGPARMSGGGVEAWLTFETETGRGKGFLRLRDGKCWTLLTTLQELKGFEEQTGPTRPLGVQHGAVRGRRTWVDRKTEAAAALGASEQPYCVIIGGGQGGIALGARLRRLGVPAIIVERNQRPGDSWRNRYASLVLHDPVWYDHLPYLPFPAHWPVFAPKDQIGDWLEAYVGIMEIPYWGGSEATAAQYDERAGEWSVVVKRDGKDIVLRPKQLVFATGAYGPPTMPAFPGAQGFAGEILHSSQYRSAAPYAGKDCVVVGSNSSAHDICADLWEQGARVTMLQRSPTTVVRSETLMDLGFKSLYSEAAGAAGIDTDTADLLFASMPFRVHETIQRALVPEFERRDADLYEGLRRAGFLLDWGVDGTGQMMKAFRTGSGYYLDVGASDLIVQGEIKVRAPVEIEEIRSHSVVLSDGGELPADLIVAATGFGSMHEIVGRIVSPAVAERVGPCWGLGSGVRGDPGPWLGEVRNLWKPTVQPNLWFHGGNLHLSRHFSQFLALQLKARMEGIATPVFAPPSPAA